MLWIVINTANISDTLNRSIDNGNLKAAQNISYYLENFLEKLKGLAQIHGGSAHLLLYERSVLQLSVDAAEQLPNVIENFMPDMQNKIGVGIGMTFEEATESAKKSLLTKKIELYEGVQDASPVIKHDLIKQNPDSSTSRQTLDFPVNVFDPEVRDSRNITRPDTKNRPTPRGQYRTDNVPNKPVLSSNNTGEDNKERTLVDTTLDEILFPKKLIEQQLESAQKQAQQAQQAQQSQQEQQKGPQTYPIYRETNEKDELEKDADGLPMADSYTVHDDTEGDREAEAREQGGYPDQEALEREDREREDREQESYPEQEEHDKVSVKLLSFLGKLKEQMPDLMKLHSTNPDAFKQVMSLINKMLILSKDRIKKNDESLTDELQKAFRKRIKRAKGIKNPEGTIIGKKIKVIVDGRAVWRQVSAGLVSDPHGKPISVKSRNKMKE